MIVVTAYSLPQEIIDWIKQESARDQRSASNFVAKILAEKMNRTKK